MIRSTDRFLTTHTGSLPRPDDLIRMMYAKEEGVPVERAALAARVRAAVAEVVRKQADAGIDLVNDGEMSKPSYATYVKDRLAGFGGTGNTFVYQDLARIPQSRQAGVRRSRPLAPQDPGVQRPDAACATPRRRTTDVGNLKAALAEVGRTEAFMSAASPGVVSLFFRNDHYPSQEAYLFAIAEAMRHEYETVANAGIVLQIDCPDLAMGRHIQYADLEPRGIPQARRDARRGAQPRARRISRPSSCACICAGATTKARTIATCALADIIDIVFAARPSAISFEAANPRHGHEWTLFERVKLPAGKVLIPGVIESKSNFIEHPELIAQRIGRYAELVGRENVIAGSDCGYGTWVGQAAVDPDVVWAKLAAMAEGARIASRQFWH